MSAEEIKKQSKNKPVKQGVNYKDGISTGSTMLNLATTGRTAVGFLPGHYYLFVGDSGSGKTFLCLTCMAEATLNPFYDEYRFIFDNAENGALMDMERFYGKKMAGRLEPPGGNRDNPKYSGTVEEFYYHVDNAFKRGDPFIYVLDSMDALTSEDEQKTFNKGRKTA